MKRIVFLFLVAVLSATSALAVEPDEVLDDPVLEARARKSARTLGASFAKTSRLTSPMPILPETCGYWSGRDWSLVIATRKSLISSSHVMEISCS